MAIVVEDGTGKSDAETYVSVSDCDAYHSKRGNASWAALSTDQKEVALRKAADYLDAKYGPKLQGQRFKVEQALLWPRLYVMVDGVCLDETPLPSELIKACCEAALTSTTADLFEPLERGGQIIEKTETVGPLTERTKWASAAPVGTVYFSIDRWMRFLLGSSGIIGSVVRG